MLRLDVRVTLGSRHVRALVPSRPVTVTDDWYQYLHACVMRGKVRATA